MTVDEYGVVREEPVPSKVRELKQDLKQKRVQLVNDRRNDKETLLKELREKKEKGAEITTEVRDHLWKKMIEEKVAADMVNKPMLELFKYKFVCYKI